MGTHRKDLRALATVWWQGPEVPQHEGEEHVVPAQKVDKRQRIWQLPSVRPGAVHLLQFGEGRPFVLSWHARERHLGHRPGDFVFSKYCCFFPILS